MALDPEAWARFQIAYTLQTCCQGRPDALAARLLGCEAICIGGGSSLGMEGQIIADANALAELGPEWASLYERSPDASPFQHPGWLLPWWRRFGSGELLCVALREGGRLAAFTPMFLHPWNGRRQVTFAGNGVSDRLGFLAEPAFQRRAIEAVFNMLAARREDWDLCDFQDLDPCLFADAMPHTGLKWDLRPQYCRIRIRLPRDAEAFREGLPPGLRRNLRRYREKLQTTGSVQFHSAKSEEAFQSGIDSLFALHASRWKRAGETGMFAGELEAFHREAALGMWRCGKARCFTLGVNGRAIAAVYGFLDKRRFWAYQSGFAPEFAPFSPGSLILAEAISEAIGEGAAEWDFLRGSESYKLEWGGRMETTSRLLVWHQHEPLDLVQVS